MTEEEREKLIELRKKKQEEKEIGYNIFKDLNLEEREQEKQRSVEKMKLPTLRGS